DHPARGKQVKAVQRHVRDGVASVVPLIRAQSAPERVAATSKTFKQLARLAGSRAGKGPYRRWVLHHSDLTAVIPKLSAMTPAQRGDLPGVARSRARQILAGAVIAETLMSQLGVDRLELCPWALREGILLRRLSPLLTP